VTILHTIFGRPASAHRLALLSLYFVACAIGEGYYSARRGPTLTGTAEAVMMLVCAALAWQVSGRAWRRWKMERHIARLQREIDAMAGAAASRKAGGR
jgi:hypothetical protein